MKINNNNKDKIEKAIHIHDYIFNGFKYDYRNNKIIISIMDSDEIQFAEITYHNVIGFQMTSCDFWGCSPHILCWEYLDGSDSIILNMLYEEMKKEDYKFSRLLSKTEYIETVITLSSGDKLCIACEYIFYEGKN